jgi:hypothetical protein
MKSIFLVAGSLSLLGLGVTAVTSNAMPKAESKDSLGQVTSVSQLSDVQPTDWAFQALQSLVERYGCIAGYPNGTFRGNRAATRYELAAALNACLDQISDKFATKEDLAAVKALQEEFKAELATLKGRVDGLEARTATLEAQQFSTTTKLEGQAIFAAQYGDQLGQGNNTGSRATAIARVRLSLNTSFNGTDLLQTTLETGNAGQDFIGGSGLALGGSSADYAEAGPNVTLQRLAYSFKPTKNLSVTIGPILEAADFIDANTYANDESSDFSSTFFINNPLIVPTEPGAGAGIDWNINGGPFSFRAAYVASSPTNSVSDGAGGGGLFGDPNQASAELEYKKAFGKEDKNNFAVRLQYTHSNIFQSDFLDDLGGDTSIQQNVIGLNTEATFGRFGIFGRFGYSIDPKIVGRTIDPDYFMTWMAGAGVKDLFVPGSLLAASVGQPLLVQGQGGPEQTNIEAFYRFPINDNISITPTITVITNPGNANQDTILQGLLRTTFSF